ncbi:hypothetical protein [Pseudophaeobacter sp.]|uniref:hypothetical protein n=1 Tax=Pseudophaeobacter sp. TaxID=1971739 RepID=UPI00329A6022
MPDLMPKLCTVAWALIGTGGRCLLFLGLLLAAPHAGKAEEAQMGRLSQWARDLELGTHAVLLERIADLAETPSEFTSDGCSGGLSESWRQVAGYWPGFAARYSKAPPFEPCCVTHDRAYHDITGARSAMASYDARLAADQALRLCVQQLAQEQGAELAWVYGVSPEVLQQAFWRLSQAMFYAVRFGGEPCSGLPWRWGYGYPNC